MKILTLVVFILTFAMALNAFARPPHQGTASGASISATNGIFGGYTIATFYPGSAMDKSLYIGFQCMQNGAIVLATSSWELHYAVSAGYATYAQIGDHFAVTLSPLKSQTYLGGHADCVIKGYAAGKKGLQAVAEGSFSID